MEALPSMEEAQAVDLADAENEQASEVEADVAQEAKETAEVPAAKGPARNGPAKGPPKGKGKSSPRLEEGKEALPSMEEAQAVDLADAEKEQASEVEADVAQEAKETAEVPAAKGPARKGPAKGPPKGKGKSSPRLEEGKEALPSMEEAQAVDLADAENEQASEVEADVAQEAKETAEASSGEGRNLAKFEVENVEVLPQERSSAVESHPENPKDHQTAEQPFLKSYESSSVGEMIRNAIGQEMESVREQISKLRQEILGMKDLRSEMQRNLDGLVAADERHCKDIEKLKNDFQSFCTQSQADMTSLTRLEERISSHRVSAKRQSREMMVKVSECQKSAEEAVKVANSQVEVAKNEAESILNVVLGKIKEEKEDHEATLQVLQQDIHDLQCLVKSPGPVVQVPQQLDSRPEQAPSKGQGQRGPRRVRQQVPQGRRHRCWKGCLRCQGISPIGQAKASLGTSPANYLQQRLGGPSPLDSTLAASFDFAESGTWEQKNIQDLLEEMEATCSASNTDG